LCCCVCVCHLDLSRTDSVSETLGNLVVLELYYAGETPLKSFNTLHSFDCFRWAVQHKLRWPLVASDTVDAVNLQPIGVTSEASMSVRSTPSTLSTDNGVNNLLLITFKHHPQAQKLCNLHNYVEACLRAAEHTPYGSTHLMCPLTRRLLNHDHLEALQSMHQTRRQNASSSPKLVPAHLNFL